MARPRVLHDSATLSTRMYAVEEDVRDLKRMFEAGFAGLHTKFDERARIQWPALSLTLAVCVTIGALLYGPIRERQIELREEFRLRSVESKVDNEARHAEGLLRDRRFLDMVIQVKEDLAKIEGRHGRN